MCTCLMNFQRNSINVLGKLVVVLSVVNFSIYLEIMGSTPRNNIIFNNNISSGQFCLFTMNKMTHELGSEKIICSGIRLGSITLSFHNV